MSVIPEQQTDTEIVVGTIVGITDKGGGKWQVAVSTDPSSQYTRGLWSSDAALVGQLATMIGQQQTFLCRVSHWTRQDGSPTRSLWIQGVGPQAAPVVPQPQPVGQAQASFVPAQAPVVVTPQVQPMAAVTHDPRISESDREQRIHRQTASKVAAILISHLPSEQRTYDNLLQIAERLVAYYTYGIEQSMGSHNPGYDGDPGPQGVPHGDDDIPF